MRSAWGASKARSLCWLTCLFLQEALQAFLGGQVPLLHAPSPIGPWVSVLCLQSETVPFGTLCTWCPCLVNEQHEQVNH